MKCITALLGGLLLSTLSTAALAQVNVEKFEANSEWNWNGEMKFENGKLSLCSVESEYEGNSAVLFMLDRNRDFMLGLVDPDFKLKKDSKTPISYWVDDNSRFKGTAIAVDSGVIIVDLPESDKLFDQLRMGSKLHYELKDETAWYGLDGTKKALEALWNCVDRGLAKEGK